MKVSIGQKYTSLKTGNTLTITMAREKRLMVESSDGSESGHLREAFEACVDNGDYVLQNLNPVELAQQIDAIYAVPLKKGFRIEAFLEDGNRIVLKKSSTRRPCAVQLYEGLANYNSPKSSVGRHFKFSKTVDKSGYGGNHLRSFVVIDAPTTTLI